MQRFAKFWQPNGLAKIRAKATGKASSSCNAALPTVPLKGKLAVSTQSSKLDSRVTKVEKFNFRDMRIKNRGTLEYS